MSSETSTKALPPGGSQPKDDGFQVSHFFVLLSLLAATVAVLMARPNAPENLILISLTIGAAGLAGLAVYRTLAPLVTPQSDLERQPLSERMRLDLQREKALTLRSIKELEFDRAMGKVSPQDFEDMAARLRARAVGIMRQLEEGSHAYRALIERELAQRLPSDRPRPDFAEASSRARQSAPPDGRQGHSESADALGTTTEGGSRQVPLCACGTQNDADARFCKACGTQLRSA